jgi:hypothetical protein
MHCYALRWRGGDDPYGAIKVERRAGKEGGTLILNPSPVREKEDKKPVSGPLGSERVSGVWIRARKLEGELDVGGRRILQPPGNP